MSGSGGCGGVGGGTAPCGIGSTGIQKADHICQNDALRPDTSRTWKALLADPTNRVACTNANCTGGTAGRVDWVLRPTTSYFKADGVSLIWVTNANGIFQFGTVTNAINNTTAFNAWTGLLADWQTNANHCGNWTNGTAGAQGAYGTSSLTDGQSITANIQNCDLIPSNLYCVEQ